MFQEPYREHPSQTAEAATWISRHASLRPVPDPRSSFLESHHFDVDEVEDVWR